MARQRRATTMPARPRRSPRTAETATAAELLERHKPLLRYDSQGSFYADSARTMPERIGGSVETPNYLKREDGTLVASAAPGEGELSLTLELLGPRRYDGGTEVRKGDYLDASGRDYVREARELHANPDFADRIYGHVARDGEGRAWLQYWFFYYFNNKAFLGFGVHEGDWEMVQIRLDQPGRPTAMTFAQHEHGERCSWQQAEKKEGTRPVVYVARGSQASYPRPGRHRAPLVPDNADGEGAEVSPTLEVLDDRAPPWVGWPGRWGSTRARNVAESNSPRGPKQHGQWAEPAAFHADAVEKLGLRGPVLGAPELRVAPSPRLRAERVGDRALIAYSFRRPERGEALPIQLVVSLDSPDDRLPPATYAFPAETRRGTVEHPLRLEDRRYVARASAFTHEGVGSETVEIPLSASRRLRRPAVGAPDGSAAEPRRASP